MRIFIIASLMWWSRGVLDILIDYAVYQWHKEATHENN